MSKTWGYARCSTNEDKQDITRQIRELKAAGAEEVIFEYEHGDAKVKKNLQLLLSYHFHTSKNPCYRSSRFR